MTCKRHPYEAGVGVCASCLRERLFSLIAAQNKLPDPNPSPPINPHPLFPRSASPRFSHRRSSGSDASAFSSFFRTPPECKSSRRKPYSLWSSFFRHSRSESSDPRSSFSWISALIRRKKSGKLCDGVGSPPPLERGMSLERCREEEEEGGGGGDSGYSSDCSAGGRLPGPTPVRVPAVRFGRAGGGGRGFSGFVVCLSPLVRSNPNRRGAERANDRIRRHVSLGDGGPVGFNRSRKFADFGRFR